MIDRPDRNPDPPDLRNFTAAHQPEKAWEQSRANCFKLLQTNELDKAFSAVRECLRDARRLWGKGSIQRGLGAELLGELYERLKRPDRAVKIYEIAIKELQVYDTKIESQPEKETLQGVVFRVRARRASALIQLDRKTQALSVMEEALSAVAGTDFCKTPGYRNVLWAAAGVSYDRSNWSLAERYLLRCLASESIGREGADSRLLLSRTYRQMDRAELALQVLDPALSKMYFASSTEYDQSLLAELTWERGLILKSQRKYEHSIMEHEEAHRLFARSVGVEDSRALNCLTSLAYVLILDGQFNRARLILDGVVETTRHRYGEHSEEIFIPQRIRGQLFLALSKRARLLLTESLPNTLSKDEAAETLRRAELDEDAAGLHRLAGERISRPLFFDFVRELRMEYLFTARHYLLDAVHVYTVAEEHNHPSLIPVYSLLARVYKLLKNSHGAEQCLKKAQHIADLLASQDDYPV